MYVATKGLYSEKDWIVLEIASKTHSNIKSDGGEDYYVSKH